MNFSSKKFSITSTQVLLPVVLLIPCVYLISSVGYWLRVPMTAAHLPMGLVASFLISRLLAKSSVQELTKSFLLIAVLFTIGMILNNYLPDIFYDSRHYHFPGIYFLSSGWNPVTHTDPCAGVAPELCEYATIFLRHYPKAYWIVGAAFYKLFNSIAATHLENFIFLVSSGWIAFHFSRRILNLESKASVVFAVLWALNPTSMWELFSNYLDGPHAGGLSVIFLGSILFLHTKEKIWLWLVVLFIPYVINLKFTGLVYVCVLGAGAVGFGLAYAQYRETKQLVLGALISLIIGVGFTGINPYVTNVVQKSNPFYPAVQSDGKDIIADLENPEFMKKNRWLKTLITQFSVRESRDSTATVTNELPENREKKMPQLEIPFTRYNFWPKTSVRMSGNGPLFSGILLLMLLAFTSINRRGWALLVTVIASVFITTASWYVRLTVQIWWIPLLVLGLAASENFESMRYRFKHRRKLMNICFFILGLNCLIVGMYTYHEQMRHGAWIDRLIETNSPIQYVLDRNSEFRRPFGLHSKILLREKTPHNEEVVSCDPVKRLEALRGMYICIRKN